MNEYRLIDCNKTWYKLYLLDGITSDEPRYIQYYWIDHVQQWFTSYGLYKFDDLLMHISYNDQVNWQDNDRIVYPKCRKL